MIRLPVTSKLVTCAGSMENTRWPDGSIYGCGCHNFGSAPMKEIAFVVTV